MIVLGFMDDEILPFAQDDNNNFNIIKERAKKAMAILGKEVDVAPENMARLILDKMGDMIKDKVDNILAEINSKPVYTIKELLYGKKLEPKQVNIIGGPAKILAPVLEEKFGLPTFYPKSYNVANAVGAALARPTTEITLHVDTSKKKLSVPELELYEKVSSNFSLSKAREKALELVKKNAKAMGATENELDAEIVEESSFNMVRGFYTTGKDIRVKAQIKPGLIHQMECDKND